MAQKNWWGRESHPSDELVYWQDPSWVGLSGTDFEKKNDQLRADWDLLHSTPELTAAFNRTMDAVREKAAGDQADLDAGEDL